MKRLMLLSIVVALIISSYCYTKAEELDIIDSANNWLLTNNLIDKAYFNTTNAYNKPLNTSNDLTGTRKTIVYGEPFGDTITVDGGTRNRYLGYTMSDAPFTNYMYPDDASGKTSYYDRGYNETRLVKKPWENPKTRSHYSVTNTNGMPADDKFCGKAEFESYIKEGLRIRSRDEMARQGIQVDYATVDFTPEQIESINWYEYMYIIQPPTDYSWGSGVLFRDNGAGYITVPIPPVRYGATSTPTITPTPTPTSTPSPLPTVVPKGNIVFVPDSCDWRNTPIDVKVYVNGDTTTKVNDIDTRSYSYTTTTVYPSPSPGRKVTKTNTSSTWWEYTQTWSIGNINVSGTNLGTAQSITNNSTITLSKDGYDTLKAELNGWVAGSKTWRAGEPPRGSWNSSSPSDTSMPSEKYYSTSGTYKIDTVKPVITFDWSNQDNFVNNTHEFIYLPNNTIKFTVSDSLSGVKSVEFAWSRTNTPGEYKSIPVQTEELKNENRTVILNVHDEYKKYNFWNLFIRVRDRAGNETVVQEKINIRAYLYDFRITSINDPSWTNYFKSGKVIKVNQLPVLDADIKNTIPKKGYNVYFSMNGKGLNESTDRIEITTRFFHASDINKKTDVEVDLYYKSNNNYIKIGSPEDVRTVKYNKQDIGHFSKIDNMPKTIIDNKTCEIKGNFYIPPDTIALPKGSNFDYNKRIKDGYLIVNIQINAYKNGELVFSYVAPSNSQWHLEGGPRSNIFYPGDAFVFNNRYSSNDDYNTTINQ
jgi:hypothetical protein